MYWSRVKTILIFLFLALDIFLLGYIIYSDYDETEITVAERENTVVVLKNNNIKIDAELIPEKTTALGIVEMNSIWTDSDKLAVAILGSGKEKISDGVYHKDNKSFEIFEDGFSYTSNAKNISKPTAASAAEKLKRINIEVDEEDGTVKGNEVVFTQKIDGFPIFETEISVKTSNDELAEVYGYRIFSDTNDDMIKKEKSLLMPISSVLINFTENDLYNKNGDEITGIETGYSIGSEIADTRHKLVSVAPAYKITLKNGDYAVYGAINGKLLYNARNEQ